MKNLRLIIFLIFFSAFFYGFLVGKYKIFPFKIMLSVKNFMVNKFDENKTTINKQYLVSNFQKMALQSNPDVVFIGDSLTYEGLWNEFFPNILVANRGINGDKTSDILKRVNSAISLSPKIIFLMAGINDVQENISINNISRNLKLIYDLIHKNKIRIILQSTIQCQKIKCGEDNVKRINLLNQEIKKISLKNNLEFLDLEDLSSETGLSSIYTYDGIHLTIEGYNYWVSKILPYLDDYKNIKEIR